MRDAHCVNQAEGREQHQAVEDGSHGAGILRTVGIEQLGDDRNAVADGIREDSRNSGIERHADTAPLVCVVIEPVAVAALGHREDVDRERRRERRVVHAGMRRVPDSGAARGFHACQIQPRHERRADERCGGQ